MHQGNSLQRTPVQIFLMIKWSVGQLSFHRFIYFSNLMDGRFEKRRIR